jgi:hypothetical protein
MVVPKPSNSTIDRLSSRPGIASSTSTSRMITSSAAAPMRPPSPPTVPASTPRNVPTTSPTATATSAAEIECEAPYTTRVYRSRPVPSVPNQCVELGASSASPTVAVGLWPVNRPGTIAHSSASSSTSAGIRVPGRSTVRARSAPREDRDGRTVGVRSGADPVSST